MVRRAQDREVDTSWVTSGGKPAAAGLSLPEDGFRRLLKLEQSGATKQYGSYCRRLAANGAISFDVERQAMNLTFIGRAMFWLRLLQPVVVVAVGLLVALSQAVIALVVALMLLVMALLFAVMLLLRWRQAYIFWPHKVVPPRVGQGDR